MPDPGTPPLEPPGGSEAATIVARFRALLHAGHAQGDKGWSPARQQEEAEAFLRDLVLAASPGVVRGTLESLLRDRPTTLPMRVDADHIPWPSGWRAVVWRALAAEHWTVAEAIGFVRGFLAGADAPRFRYWEAKEAVCFLADFYRESPAVVAFLLEAREVSDFDYLVDVVVQERFAPTEVWAPALIAGLRGDPQTKTFLVARLARLMRTHPDVRRLLEDALRADPLSFSIDAWRAYVAGAPDDQTFRAGMEAIVETLIAARVGGLAAYNLLPFDFFMERYPADAASLRLCLRAAFEGPPRLQPLAVDWLGRKFWRFEATRPALLRALQERAAPEVRAQAFYALMLRHGADPRLRRLLCRTAAAESAPEAREAMIGMLTGAPIHPPAVRPPAERDSERRLFRSVCAPFRAEGLGLASPELLRRRIDALTGRIALLESTLALARLRRAAGHGDAGERETLVEREQAAREKAEFETALREISRAKG